MAKTILMLGGSPQQLVAIETAKRLGYRTVLCDYLPDNPGQYEVDVFYQVSTTDKGAILRVAQDEKVDGVLAYASDPASPIAAYVAEKLGLPTNSLSTVETMSQKHLFREHLKSHGFPCPRSISFSSKTDPEKIWQRIEDFEGAIVVKPTDSSGSKGVSIVQDRQNFDEAVKTAASISRNGILVAEEYLEKGYPYVVGGDVFVIDGKIKFWGLMDCLRDAHANLVPTGKMYPAGLSASQEQAIKKVLQDLVESLSVRFGELNVEVILGKNDIPYVIELGSRAGGNMIPVQLSDMSGIDLVAANVLCAMGEKPNGLEFEQPEEAYATHVLHSLKEGDFVSVQIDDELSSRVYRTVLYAQEGDVVEPFNGANRALGIVFLKFDSPQQMNDNMARINEHIHISLK